MTPDEVDGDCVGEGGCPQISSTFGVGASCDGAW